MTADEKYVFQLVRTYNSRTTPTLVIGDEVLVGFDPERVDAALGR